jgi:hypothetical protein
MKRSETIGKISAALLRAQRKMGAASKGASNPFFRSKYADYGAVLEVVKDPLNEEGITILQPTYSDTTGHYVETLLVHESGEFISSGSLRLELSKVDMQALGSSITYARRYQLQSLTGTPAEDDDAEGSMNRNKPATKPVVHNTTTESLVTQSNVTVTNAVAAEPPKARTSFRKPPKPEATTTTNDDFNL